MKTEVVVKKMREIADSMKNMPVFNWNDKPISESISYQMFCQDLFYEPVEGDKCYNPYEAQPELDDKLAELWCGVFADLGRQDVVEYLEDIGANGL